MNDTVGNVVICNIYLHFQSKKNEMLISRTLRASSLDLNFQGQMQMNTKLSLHVWLLSLHVLNLWMKHMKHTNMVVIIGHQVYPISYLLMELNSWIYQVHVGWNLMSSSTTQQDSWIGWSRSKVFLFERVMELQYYRRTQKRDKIRHKRTGWQHFRRIQCTYMLQHFMQHNRRGYNISGGYNVRKCYISCSTGWRVTTFQADTGYTLHHFIRHRMREVTTFQSDTGYTLQHFMRHTMIGGYNISVGWRVLQYFWQHRIRGCNISGWHMVIGWQHIRQ